MARHALFVRLLPPRPTFHADMSPEERRLMAEHASYMKAQLDAGHVLVYGPVLDPAGVFGMAVFTVADEGEARRILDGDPTVKAGLNRYELAPMAAVVARAP